MGIFNKKNGGEKEDVRKQQYNKITQEIIQKVNCPHQVFSEKCTMEEVNRAYEKALKRGQKEGFVPVLVPSDETFAEWLSILEDEEYSKEELLKQPCDNGAEILKERYQEYTEEYVEDFGDGAKEGDGEFLLSELMGEKENGEELLYLTSFRKYSEPGIEETILFEIPVDMPWKVISYLPMGGWNECPDNKEMMAICRYWYEQYGAMPAVISHDTLEFVVRNRITEDSKAWELAKEQYAFCPDRVDQCTASYTIGELADCISKSTVWYFWWD